jgi:hypothetical protein
MRKHSVTLGGKEGVFGGRKVRVNRLNKVLGCTPVIGYGQHFAALQHCIGEYQAFPVAFPYAKVTACLG